MSIADRPVTAVIRRRAAWHVLDWLGIAFAATGSPQAQAFERYAGLNTDTLIPGALAKAALTPTETAFLLGGLGNILEMDDLHKASIMHTGNAVVPAALATAIASGSSGPALLDAVVRGYEVAIRIGTAAASAGYRPFMNSTTCGVFGAATAAASTMGLEREAHFDAWAQAGMMASGLWQCRVEPGFAKQVASAHAARAGVEAAQLAAAGMSGPREILSGPLGFFAALYPDAAPEAVADDPDAEWRIADVSFKPWPACRHTHPAIGAALELRARLDAAAQSSADIDRIVIRTYRAAIEFCDCPEPASDDAARFSLQHAVAVALLRGAPDIRAFGAAARADAPTSDLRRKTVLEEDATFSAAFPEQLASAVTLDIAGTQISAGVEHALGDPENPMSEDALLDKFRRNVAMAGVSGPSAARMIETVMDLPKASDVGDLRTAIGTSEISEPGFDAEYKEKA